MDFSEWDSAVGIDIARSRKAEIENSGLNRIFWSSVWEIG